MNNVKLKSIYFFIIVILISACSSLPNNSGVSIVASNDGLMKNRLANFPIYLTNSLINRMELEQKYSSDIFIIHTGHIFKADLSKEENEKNLEALITSGINIINLTKEDFIIADSQAINFENYNQNFLNSSVVDLSIDALAKAKNINSYYIQGAIAFVGLSDDKIDKKLIAQASKEKYIINDYVLDILKAKQEILQNSNPSSVQSFIIIHTLGNEINKVMTRLPPSFLNSLTN